ncbi:UNVERIFIED_CONTAM: hypothetical protein K2H54_027681 [Gekko kuhli]
MEGGAAQRWGSRRSSRAGQHCARLKKAFDQLSENVDMMSGDKRAKQARISVDDSIADALSHLQEERFRTLALGANHVSDPFPEQLWELGKIR